MVKNEIKMISEDSEKFDKKQIALSIRNSALNDELGCSLKEEGILKSCESCSLKNICTGIDQVADDYHKSITKVVQTFNFE